MQYPTMPRPPVAEDLRVTCACGRQTLPAPGIVLQVENTAQAFRQEVHRDIGFCYTQGVDGPTPLERQEPPQAAPGEPLEAVGTLEGQDAPDDVQEAIQGLAEAMAAGTQPLVDLISADREEIASLQSAVQRLADERAEAIRHLSALLNTAALKATTWAHDDAAVGSALEFLETQERR